MSTYISPVESLSTPPPAAAEGKSAKKTFLSGGILSHPLCCWAKGGERKKKTGAMAFNSKVSCRRERGKCKFLSLPSNTYTVLTQRCRQAPNPPETQTQTVGPTTTWLLGSERGEGDSKCSLRPPLLGNGLCGWLPGQRRLLLLLLCEEGRDSPV